MVLSKQIAVSTYKDFPMIYEYGRIMMIRIVVCDDKLTELNIVKSYLHDFKQKYPSLDIRSYSSSLELKNDVLSIQSTDIFLLDIVMPNFSGIEIGQLIREHNKDACIIFFTTSKDYALDAYGVKALQYLVKPIKKEDLFDAIKKGITLANKKDRYYYIATKSAIIPVKIKDIKYIEYRDHFLYFYVNDKTYISKFFRQSFEIAIKDLFEHPEFLQTHRAYLINMRHVEKLLTSSFYLTNNQIIPISKNRLNEVRKTYMNYLLRG